MKTVVEIGIDTGPGQYPRSDTYDQEGMLLEGWTAASGKILFGCFWYRKTVEDRRAGKKLIAEIKSKANKLYLEGWFRGAEFGILYFCPDCSGAMPYNETDVRICEDCGYSEEIQKLE